MLIFLSLICNLPHIQGVMGKFIFKSGDVEEPFWQLLLKKLSQGVQDKIQEDIDQEGIGQEDLTKKPGPARA